MNELNEAKIRQECANRAEIALRTPLNKLLGKGWRSLARWEASDLIIQHVKDAIIRNNIEHIDRPILVMIEGDIPPMTVHEQWEMRKFLALSHEDGKCHIYGDDGELQCGNTARHGRSLDFRREPISDLLENIQFTRLREYQENKATPDPDTMGLVRQKVKDIVEYIISDGKGYNGVSGDIENKINTALNEVDVLFDSGLVAPDPDVELLPDAEYGFVARYKSLTADGKTKDEAMQELARVILAAFDSEPEAIDLEVVSEVAVGVWLTPYQAAAEAAWRDMMAVGELGPKSQYKMIVCLGEHFKAAMIAAASKLNKRVPRAML